MQEPSVRTLAHMTSIPVSAMYLHARTFCTLAHATSMPMGVMYLHARMFCTLANTTSIPVGAMYLHTRKLLLIVHSLIRSYSHCGHQFFSVITEFCPCAN